MDDLEIRVIDPFDEAQLRAWVEVYRLAEECERPFATPWAYEELRAQVQAPPVARELVSLVGVLDGRVVATGGLGLNLKDNLDTADVLVHTHPDEHRKGFARRLLAWLENEAAARGRSVAVASLDYPYASGPAGGGAPNVELFRSAGYTPALEEVQRSLAVPVDEALLEELAAECRPHHGDYSFASWVGHCPDEHVESYGRLIGTLVTEAPSGDLVVEEEVYDAARVRHEEELSRQSGRSRYVTVALDRTGEVVAYTEIVVPRHDPGKAFQWGTLVHPAHRGHRLGLAVKVANQAALQRQHHDVTRVITWNAEVNDHMIEVNERLGYVPSGRSAQWQKRLAGGGPA